MIRPFPSPLFACLALAAGLVLVATPAAARQDPPPLMTDLVVLDVDPVWFGDVAWADYDMDGRYDIVVSGNRGPFEMADPFTQLYLNVEDTFVERPDPAGGENPIQVPAIRFAPAFNIGTTPLTARWYSSVAWTDVDADGRPDFAVSGRSSSGFVEADIYLRNAESPNGTFLWRTVPGTRAGDMAWGDFTGDGRPDLVLTGLDLTGRPATLMYANGITEGQQGEMIPWNHDIPGLAHGSVDLGDYDLDGDLDLLVTGIAEPQAVRTLLYRNDGNGVFTEVAAGLRGMLFSRARWLDFDGDADLDIVLSGGRLGPLLIDGTLVLYRNDGGTFVDASDGLEGAFENDPARGRYQGALSIADMDNDGYGDFIALGIRTPIIPDIGRIYRRRTQGGYRKDFKEKLAGGYLGGADAADYDGDGDVDLVAVGREEGVGLRVRVYRSAAPRPDLGVLSRNAPPGPPRAPSSTVDGRRVRLEWESATDDLTPAGGLTYHVRVGTATGRWDVVAAMADPVTGRRLAPGRGNAGGRLDYVLDSLPPGVYHWSVQAVDAGWAGSPFTEEQVFVIAE